MESTIVDAVLIVLPLVLSHLAAFMLGWSTRGKIINRDISGFIQPRHREYVRVISKETGSEGVRVFNQEDK